MTTTVLMLETRAAGASTVHQSGTQYPLSDDLASFYIGKGYATLISPQPANLVPVMGQVNPLTGGIELSAGGVPVTVDDLSAAPADQRFVLQNTAGIYQQSGVSRAVDGLSYRIPRMTYYVSSEATNGFVVGSDASSGLSKAAAKLTLSSAFAAASAGDVIIINDSATPYDSAFYNLNKSITILPWTARGVTLRSTFASYAFLIGASDITLGALIIDTNAVCASALRSVAAPCNNLRLVGTKLKSHSTYHLNHIGTVEMIGGFECESVGASKSYLQLNTASAGTVTIGAGSVIDGHIAHSPTVAGVNTVLSGVKIRSASAGAVSAFQSVGASSYLIEDCDIGVDTSTSGSGILITPHASLACSSIIIRRNSVSNGVAAAQQTAGYGVAVGNETAIAETIAAVEIYENDISHANHGLFAGYGISSGYSRGNVVRDTVVGCISKGNACGFVHAANVVLGGPLTGGGLRSKTTSNAKFYNNLVVFDAQSVAAGVGQQADTTSVNSDYQNNIIYAPAVACSKAAVLASGSSATYANNDYYAGSFGAAAFDNGGTTYGTVALWAAAKESTALNVDPLFVGNGDYRLQSSSHVIGVGDVLTSTDFLGLVMSKHLGPMATAA